MPLTYLIARDRKAYLVNRMYRYSLLDPCVYRYLEKHLGVEQVC